MVRTPASESDTAVAQPWDPLTGEPEPAGARLAELERLLRDNAARLAALEQQREREREQEEPPAPCPRCARLAESFEFFAERLREKEERLAASERAEAAKDARIATLEKRLAELEKRVHRSAAPFRRLPEERNPNPQPPGRPNGHPGACRPVPAGPLETEYAPLACCPHCQGAVTEVHPIEQVIVELPSVQPIVRRVVTYAGRCAQCGAVRSTHPLQVSTATGAAGVQLGPHALAVAADLRHGHGLTLRRTCAILREHFGLPLSHSGLYQALARLAETVGPEYAGLKHELHESSSVHADETGWWLRNQGAWLWVVTTPRTTVYHISRYRNAAALKEVLGERYEGVLVSDCLRVYDRYEAAAKSKCVAHHLRAIKEAQVKLPGSPFLRAIRRLLLASLKLQRSAERLPEAVYQRGVESLERRLTRLLAPTYAPEEEEKVAQRFRNQREHIFTFLHQPGVAATNNLAERQLRPAVITRKLSCGNETEAGARVWEVLSSLAATCRQRGEAFVAFIANRVTLDGATTGLSPPSRA